MLPEKKTTLRETFERKVKFRCINRCMDIEETCFSIGVKHISDFPQILVLKGI